MRYILNNEGYIFEVSFGAEIYCSLGTCTQYTGPIPEGYETLVEWHDTQIAEKKLNAWKVVDNNLVFDEVKCNELKELYEKQEKDYSCATNKYVNDRFNQVNNVIVDELTDHKEGTGIVKLIDSGNYDISSLKIYLQENVDKVQVKVTNNNLIKNEAVTQEISGVNVTVNEDKTMVLDGIAEDDIEIVLCGTNENTDMLFTVKANTNYYQGGLLNGTRIILNSFNGEDRTEVSNGGNGLINVNEDYVVTEVILTIAAGATFFNSKIYPMFTMNDTPEEYTEHEENELLEIELSEVKNGDYLIIANSEVALVSGKKERQILELTNNLKAYYPTTHVMINRSYNMAVDYYRDKYLVNTINEIKSNLDGISLKVSETFEATDTIHGENVIKLENAFAPSNLTELEVTGEMSIVYPANDLYPSNDLYPMETILAQSQNEDMMEANRYSIPINYLHYIDENVHDKFILTPEECKIIRKVGENEDGTLYALEEEVEETFEGVQVPMFEGTNYFTVETFKIEKLYFKATYEINKMNGNYATKAELQLTENSINAEVLKKVGNDEIIAKINMAIQGIEPDDDGNIPEDVEKSIIEIIANKLSIKSDYTQLTPEGHFTTTSAKIANWILNDNCLFANTQVGDNLYQSGLDSRSNDYMLYAGLDLTDGESHYLSEANAYITKSGKMYAKWFDVNGESGHFNINFDSGRIAAKLNKNMIQWRIDDDANENFITWMNATDTSVIHMGAARCFYIMDTVHGLPIFRIEKYSPETGVSDGPRIYLDADVYVTGNNLGTGEETKLILHGYEILQSASDERLKDNIVDSEIEALKLINKIHHKSFDWNKEKAHKEGHIDIGYIAQELIKIDPNFVVYSERHDTYQINTLYVLCTATKAIQELDDKIDKQQKMIDFLANKLGCKEELEEYMKGEN
jgi:hypothetical protein